MHRRHVLAGLATLPLLPHMARASAGFVEYTDGMIDAVLALGKTVFVDYYASWCSTCARQERVIGALLSDNPAYADNVMFVRVNWDK